MFPILIFDSFLTEILLVEKCRYIISRKNIHDRILEFWPTVVIFISSQYRKLLSRNIVQDAYMLLLAEMKMPDFLVASYEL